MSFGALLTDSQGVPFYIDGTRPLTLVNKVVFSVPSPGGLRSIDLYPNDGVIRFVFIQDNAGTTSNYCSWLQMDSNTWRLYMNYQAGTSVTVFIFGYANQPVPAWGVAIWDAQNNCILTNESKVLRDVTSLGDQSSDTNSGFRFTGTLAGSWAVAPFWSGLFTGVDNSTGQARPVSATFYLAAHFNGSQTFLRSGIGQGSVDGNVSNPSYSNSRCLLTCINVDKY
ncbi:hypothetical protein QMA77_05125 [Pantoea ananatis]|uniref:hypothetical protein n=1 Tax=Pantoea ananas TaxID=553 RepID=UPI001575C23A|nr:hypothetical protein [Pantoea ananatis]MDI6536318.1 hypothetical protein [Pantoea ananatis]